jgi:tetratricopeptide (TPR) repeat protein
VNNSDAENHEADIRFEKALEHYQAGQLHETQKICKNIYSTDPGFSPALHLLGMVAFRMGLHDVAVNLMGAAVKIRSDVAFYHKDLGNVFLSQDRVDESILCYRNALRLDPNFVRAYYHLSVALTKKDLLDEAIQSLVIALKLKPDYTDALYQSGIVLSQRDQPDEAIACFQKVLKVEPTRAEALFALGAALDSIDREDEAIDCYRNVLQIEPDHVYALNNLGFKLKERGETEQAMDMYRKAIEISPDLAGPHWNLSHVLLLTGDLEAGWKEFEWRLRKDDWRTANLRPCKVPLWKGESFAGKTLFIHDEQGLGDTIQFVRYLPMVKAFGGDIIFETQESLIGLFKNFQGIDRLVPHSAESVLPTDMDLYAPLLSLPAIFNTTLDTIPDTVPYLHADTDKTTYWKKRHTGDGFKVGIVWAGGPKNPNDRNRSCRLRHFASLSDIGTVRLIGIQKGKAAEQVRDLPSGMEVINYGPELEDFTDTMALIENLDLIIAVDTAVAHLAGAMGKPVWLILTFAHHWPWLLNRTDSPWYPSMRIYRQKKKGDWASVFDRVEKDLNARVSSRRY